MQRAVRRVSPYRNRSTLQSWLDEFAALEYPLSGEIRVIEQDGEEGFNTGLVRVRIGGASAGAYIQPVSVGAKQWVVTMEATDDAVDMTAAALMNLATELTTISALCAFLEAKSSATPADQS